MLLLSGCFPSTSAGVTTFDVDMEKRAAYDLALTTMTGTTYELPQNPNMDRVGWVVESGEYEAGIIRAYLVETENPFALGLRRYVNVTVTDLPEGGVRVTINTESFAPRVGELERRLIAAFDGSQSLNEN